MSSLVLSGGVDGKACIYDINRKVMVNHVQYSSSVTAIRWLPLDVSRDANFPDIFIFGDSGIKGVGIFSFLGDRGISKSDGQFNTAAVLLLSDGFLWM